MSEKRDNQRARKIAKSSGKVILAPFRAVGQSGKLTKNQFVSSLKAGHFRDASNTIRKNWKTANKKGRNDQFFEIFGGPDGPELLQWNLRRFLLKKRTALGCMAAFVAYGVVCVIVFQALSGLLGILGAVILGCTFATDAQFRLWQLRNHRLSREEKGGFQHFWREQPILQIFNPELGSRRHGS